MGQIEFLTTSNSKVFFADYHNLLFFVCLLCHECRPDLKDDLKYTPTSPISICGSPWHTRRTWRQGAQRIERPRRAARRQQHIRRPRRSGLTWCIVAQRACAMCVRREEQDEEEDEPMGEDTQKAETGE